MTGGTIALRMYQKENHFASQNSQPIAPMLGVRENIWAMFSLLALLALLRAFPFFGTNAKLSHKN